MLRAPQREHLERLLARIVHTTRKVIHLRELPAAGLRDAAFRPRQRLVVKAELTHRLGDANELVRGRQIPTEQPHDRVDVAVEDREPLARIANGERVAVAAGADGVAIRGHPGVTERPRVPNRIDLEEVLIVELEADHPRGQIDRLRHADIARPGVQRQQLAGQIPDQPVGVVGMHDHLDDVSDRPLQQLDQRPRRGLVDGLLQFGDDRPSGAGPSRALAVAEESARAKTPIHLRAQLRQTARAATDDQPHLPLDITVTIDRRRDDLPQLIDRQPGDQLLDRNLRSDARSSTRHRRIASLA
ncbi:MAG: hypothetical protein ACRDPC_13275 [Solirubrobacteraceae bacterium]